MRSCKCPSTRSSGSTVLRPAGNTAKPRNSRPPSSKPWVPRSTPCRMPAPGHRRAEACACPPSSTPKLAPKDSASRPQCTRPCTSRSTGTACSTGSRALRSSPSPSNPRRQPRTSTQPKVPLPDCAARGLSNSKAPARPRSCRDLGCTAACRLPRTCSWQSTGCHLSCSTASSNNPRRLQSTAVARPRFGCPRPCTPTEWDSPGPGHWGQGCTRPCTAPNSRPYRSTACRHPGSSPTSSSSPRTQHTHPRALPQRTLRSAPRSRGSVGAASHWVRAARWPQERCCPPKCCERRGPRRLDRRRRQPTRSTGLGGRPSATSATPVRRPLEALLDRHLRAPP
mmetsp:Transcript_37375/g.106040  ORF Transcript_37375/g.106040 Transcript_37375/m.106040 type:complete len:339 (-) Transcript_37375:14-1030(-)